MSAESDIFGFEKIMPDAAKAGFTALLPELKSYTVSDSLPLQRERPRVEFDFVTGPGQGMWISRTVTNLAGETAEMFQETSWKGQYLLDVITAAEITVHNAWLSAVRATMHRMAATVNGSSALSRHNIHPKGGVKESGTTPRYSPQDGVFQSRLIFDIDFSVQADAWASLNT